MKAASAYKALCQEDKLFLQDTAQKVAMLVAKPPKTMDYFRKQLTEFADKWTAYETAKEAERKGKWQPSMGRPSNPLWAIWPRNAGASCFPDFGDIPPVLGGYALLAIIHDKVLPRCPSIATEILPKELVNKIWRDIVTGANEEHSSSRRVIPVLKIENFLGGVEVDIENHFAPKNSPRKIHPYFQFVDENHFGQKNGTTQKPAARDGKADTAVDTTQATPAPAIEKAYQSYQYAIEKNPDFAGKKDKEVYTWLKNNGIDDYTLPAFETWQRYVREGRKHYGTSKNTPRAGRTGRSIITSQ